MTKTAAASLRFRKLVCNGKFHFLITCCHHLRHTLSIADHKRFVAPVDQGDLYFPAVIAVDGSNAIDKTAVSYAGTIPDSDFILISMFYDPF